MPRQSWVRMSAVMVAVCALGALLGCGGIRPPREVGAAANPWAGCYKGAYTGDESGTFRARVRADGHATATIHSPYFGRVRVTGTVTRTGTWTASGQGSGPAGPVTLTWAGTGRLKANGVRVCSGTWTSDVGYSGTWQGRSVACP